MKRSLSPWPLFVLLSLLTLLVLTACERPARTDTSTTPETTQEGTEPIVIPLQETPMGLPEIPPVTDGTTSNEPATPDPTMPEATVDPNAPTTDSSTSPSTGDGAAPTTTPSTYIIQSGDTIGRVAERFGLSLQALIAANPQITNPDRVQIGDVINIPGAGGTTTTPPQEGDRVHRVQAGENLYRIGLLYGCTVAQLSSHNNLANPDRLEIGQEIRIPNCN